jgi:hypothetical protein
VRGLHPQSRSVIEVAHNLDGSGISVGAAFEKDENRWAETVLRSEEGRIYIPRPTSPDAVLLSRFLAKVSVESLALQLIEEDGGLEAVLSEPSLDPLRNYARRGPPTPTWPFHSRTLYPADFGFSRPGQEAYEVLHEWLFTDLGGDSLYFVLGLFGVEYTLNLGEREIESYKVWLNANSGGSPLYPRGIENS